MKRVLADFDDLTPAEERLRDEVGSGLDVVLGDGKCPGPEAGPDRQINASFLRYLALGGCEACRPSEKGVRLVGGLIVSDGQEGAATRGLDLESCEVPGNLGLGNCHFPDTPLLRDARLGLLSLTGSTLAAGLSADRLVARGGVFLRGVQAIGEVRLPGAKVGGVLDCMGARFEAVVEAKGSMGYAFTADGLEADGGIKLSNVQATGQVRLLGAKLGGVLDCAGARFEAVAGAKGVMGDSFSADGLDAAGSAFLRNVQATGAVRLPGVNLVGDLDCTDAKFEAQDGRVSLHLQRARVSGALLLREGSLGEGTRITGTLNLTDATFGSLCDEPAAWPQKGVLHLDRCRYGAFLGGAPVDAESRLEWLALGPDDPARGAFNPQPYEQLAKVLREIGHSRDARKVLERKEHFQRLAGVGQLPEGSPRRPLRRAWNWVLRWTVGYGHYPVRALYWLAGFWLIGTVAFLAAYRTGDFKPNNAFVLRADEWVLCGSPTGSLTDPQQRKLDWIRQSNHPHQLACFEAQDAARSYPVFNAGLYAADVLLPVVALEMQYYWIPDAENSWLGIAARWMLWLQILVGWALSLLAVAGLSGVIKSDR